MHYAPNCSVNCSKESNYEVGSTKCFNYGLYPTQRMIGLTLPEAFSISLVGLVGHSDHVCKYFWQENWYNIVTVSSYASYVNEEKIENDNNEKLIAPPYSETTWYKFLIDTLFQKRSADLKLTDEHLNNDTLEQRGAKVIEVWSIR